MRAALAVVSGFIVLASAWLVVMTLVLRHPGFEWRAALAAGFAGLGALALGGSVLARPGVTLRVAMGVAGVCLAVAGVWAIRNNVDEGFVDVIGVAFLLEAALTTAVVFRKPS